MKPTSFLTSRTTSLLITICLTCCLILCGCVSSNSLEQEINKIPQNNLVFLKNNQNIPAVSPKIALRLKEKYIKDFFAPWETPFLWQNQNSIKADYTKILRNFTKHPVWYANPSLSTIHIKNNINLATYPNLKLRAITIRATNLRFLPIDQPSFGDWRKEGKNHPFDNFQTAFLNINVPLFILHTTHDRVWDLVITPYNCVGWVKSTDLAYVDNNFINDWQNHTFIVATKDAQPIYDDNGQRPINSRIGDLFPLLTNNYSSYQVLVAAKNQTGYAQFKTVNLNKQFSEIWPLKITTKNIASLANRFLGKHYGWGGVHGLRDCSSTMQALFTPFGIWLPRNSTAQADTGEFIPLDDYSDRQKEKIIRKTGQPFLTLIWLHGHIMLYIGEINGKAYAFHDPWRLHIKNSAGHLDQRGIIGRTVITSLDIGKNLRNNNWVYLELISGMTFLVKNYN